MKLCQTLANSWVITIDNPEEDHMETELAVFDTHSTEADTPARDALEEAAAAAYVTLLAQFSGRPVRIEAHDTRIVGQMRARVMRLLDTQRGPIA